MRAGAPSSSCTAGGPGQALATARHCRVQASTGSCHMALRRLPGSGSSKELWFRTCGFAALFRVQACLAEHSCCRRGICRLARQQAGDTIGTPFRRRLSTQGLWPLALKDFRRFVKPRDTALRKRDFSPPPARTPYCHCEPQRSKASRNLASGRRRRSREPGRNLHATPAFSSLDPLNHERASEDCGHRERGKLHDCPGCSAR